MVTYMVERQPYRSFSVVDEVIVKLVVSQYFNGDVVGLVAYTEGFEPQVVHSAYTNVEHVGSYQIASFTLGTHKLSEILVLDVAY